jgi:uncharacterized protein YbcC (UPF0753/DUF2309 family)
MINPTIQKKYRRSISSRRKDLAFVFFVTSNPLSGYEGMPFEKQLIRHENTQCDVFPESTVFRQAWEKGEIDENILLKLLGENQLLESPEYYLQQMASHKKSDVKTAIMI